MTCATLAILLGVNFHASEPSPENFGPGNSKWWFELTGVNINYIFPTTLSMLARNSDIIGVGKVSNKQDTHFTVTVDFALAGCTNGAVIVVYDGLENDDIFPTIERQNYLPANNSRIVFAAYTNDYNDLNMEVMHWDYLHFTQTPETILPNPTLRYLNRSWWYLDYDDGVLFTQFTNIIQTVRIEPNWTNYFHLCRDGAFSTSERVKIDSFWDMNFFAAYATPEQKATILADPLVDTTIKMLLNPDDWIVPDFEFP